MRKHDLRAILNISGLEEDEADDLVINLNWHLTQNINNLFLPAAKPSGPRTVGVVVGGAVWRSSKIKIEQEGSHPA